MIDPNHYAMARSEMRSDVRAYVRKLDEGAPNSYMILAGLYDDWGVEVVDEYLEEVLSE